MYELFGGLLFGGLLFLAGTMLAGAFVGDHIDTNKQKIRAAIEQCEAILPRNQTCEVVITARVKEKKP